MDKETTTGLQNFLNDNVKEKSAGEPIEVNGLFGPETIEAMGNFIARWEAADTSPVSVTRFMN